MEGGLTTDSAGGEGGRERSAGEARRATGGARKPPAQPCVFAVATLRLRGTLAVHPVLRGPRLKARRGEGKNLKDSKDVKDPKDGLGGLAANSPCLGG